MILPTLPKVYSRKEADWTTKVFRHWLEKNSKTGVYEVKYAKGDSLPFSAVLPHQIENLLAVRHKTFVYKVVDMGEKNPFDIFCLTEQPAYVVVKYSKGFVLISVDAFVLESQKSKRRSLTFARACDIAFKVVL
jgi:hypothetical protein